MSNEGVKSRFAVAIAIVAVSTSSILIRYSQSGPLTIAFYRLLFNTLLLLPWLLIFRIRELRSLRAGDMLRLAIVGLVLSVHFSSWITSLGFTTVANSVVLVSTHPLIVAAISTIFLKERPSRTGLAGGIIAIAGVFIMFIGNLTMHGLAGNLLALTGALAAGMYIVAGRSERKKLSTLTYCSIVYGSCTLFLAPLAFLESGFLPAARFDWYLFLAMALIPGILGHTLYNYSLGRVPAFLVSTSLVGEPVIASILAALLLHEIPSATSLIGAPLVLIGIFLAAKQLNN